MRAGRSRRTDAARRSGPRPRRPAGRPAAGVSVRTGATVPPQMTWRPRLLEGRSRPSGGVPGRPPALRGRDAGDVSPLLRLLHRAGHLGCLPTRAPGRLPRPRRLGAGRLARQGHRGAVQGTPARYRDGGQQPILLGMPPGHRFDGRAPAGSHRLPGPTRRLHRTPTPRSGHQPQGRPWTAGGLRRLPCPFPRLPCPSPPGRAASLSLCDPRHTTFLSAIGPLFRSSHRKPSNRQERIA